MLYEAEVYIIYYMVPSSFTLYLTNIVLSWGLTLDIEVPDLNDQSSSREEAGKSSTNRWATEGDDSVLTRPQAIFDPVITCKGLCYGKATLSTQSFIVWIASPRGHH